MKIRLCNAITLKKSNKISCECTCKHVFHYNILFYWADKEMNVKANFLIIIIIIQSYTI